jgi:hypothetical protein
LWDAGSGAEQQTLEVEAIVLPLAFSDDGKFLQTDRGQLSTTIISDRSAVSRPDPLRSIFIEREWVTWAAEKIIWLPSEHRPRHVAVHGAIAASGYRSGRVSFIEFVLQSFSKVSFASSYSDVCIVTRT